MAFLPGRRLWRGVSWCCAPAHPLMLQGELLRAVMAHAASESLGVLQFSCELCQQRSVEFQL